MHATLRGSALTAHGQHGWMYSVQQDLTLQRSLSFHILHAVTQAWCGSFGRSPPSLLGTTRQPPSCTGETASLWRVSGLLS